MRIPFAINNVVSVDVHEDADKIAAVLLTPEGDTLLLGMTLGMVDRLIENLQAARKLAEAKGAEVSHQMVLRPLTVGAKVWQPEENRRYVALAIDPGTALAQGFLLSPKVARDIGRNLIETARKSGG